MDSDERLGVVDQLRLGLSRTFYSVASALPNLTHWLQSAQLAADATVWLLGQSYGDPSAGTLTEEVRGGPRTAQGGRAGG